MRRLLLIVMIALLPLRAWMGDAMAMSMVSFPVQGTQQSTAHQPACADHMADKLEAERFTPTAIAHDSKVQHGGGAHADNTSHDAVTDHVHTSCDLCNGPAMGQPSVDVLSMSAVHGMQPGPLERFASAASLRGVKPPIS